MKRIICFVLVLSLILTSSVLASESSMKITENEIKNDDGTISKFRFEEYIDKLIVYSQNPKYSTLKAVHDKINNTVTLYELQEIKSLEVGTLGYKKIAFIDKNKINEKVESHSIIPYRVAQEEYYSSWFVGFMYGRYGDTSTTELYTLKIPSGTFTSEIVSSGSTLAVKCREFKTNLTIADGYGDSGIETVVEWLIGELGGDFISYAMMATDIIEAAISLDIDYVRDVLIDIIGAALNTSDLITLASLLTDASNAGVYLYKTTVNYREAKLL